VKDERHGYPAGVPCWVDTSQPDPKAAVDFYGGLFGWEFEDTAPPDQPGHYFIGRLRGLDVAAIGSQVDGAPPTPVWNTYICVESADDAARKVKSAGGAVLSDPFDIPGAGRMAVFADPDGAAFCVWQPGDFKGAQLVNVPGTWGWSDLNTRDMDAVKNFYKAVFGWEADTAENEGDYAMLRRPGYGDFLEQSDPELRKRLAAQQAPPGFEDVVGWMVRMTSEQFSDDTPSHWGITFAVEDTDAAVDKAGALGAKVLVPPVDIPPVRIAVLADPQGAMFTVSKYTPPN
jgi:predicted enzyme related to lactoylglutathione lyase